MDSKILYIYFGKENQQKDPKTKQKNPLSVKFVKFILANSFS